jgi:hypothetical protein
MRLKIALLAEKAGDIPEAIKQAELCRPSSDYFPRLEAYIERLRSKEKILTEYPPGPEWNEERKASIRMKVIQGEPVSPRERRFYMNFTEWEKAMDPEGCGIDAPAPGERTPEILVKFPPGTEWNAERKRQIVLKMFSDDGPSPLEREFYRRYGEWEQAVKSLHSNGD